MVSAVYTFSPITSKVLKVGNKVFKSAAASNTPERKSTRQRSQQQQQLQQNQPQPSTEEVPVFKHNLLLEPTLARQKRRQKEKDKLAAEAAAKAAFVEAQKKKHEEERERERLAKLTNTSNLTKALARAGGRRRRRIQQTKQKQKMSPMVTPFLFFAPPLDNSIMTQISASDFTSDSSDATADQSTHHESVVFDKKPQGTRVSRLRFQKPELSTVTFRYSSMEVFFDNNHQSTDQGQQNSQSLTAKMTPRRIKSMPPQRKPQKPIRPKGSQAQAAKELDLTNLQDVPIASIRLPKSARAFLKWLGVTDVNDFVSRPNKDMAVSLVKFRELNSLKVVNVRSAASCVRGWKKLAQIPPKESPKEPLQKGSQKVSMKSGKPSPTKRPLGRPSKNTEGKEPNICLEQHELAKKILAELEGASDGDDSSAAQPDGSSFEELWFLSKEKQKRSTKTIISAASADKTKQPPRLSLDEPRLLAEEIRCHTTTTTPALQSDGRKRKADSSHGNDKMYSGYQSESFSINRPQSLEKRQRTTLSRRGGFGRGGLPFASRPVTAGPVEVIDLTTASETSDITLTSHNDFTTSVYEALRATRHCHPKKSNSVHQEMDTNSTPPRSDPPSSKTVVLKPSETFARSCTTQAPSFTSQPLLVSPTDVFHEQNGVSLRGAGSEGSESHAPQPANTSIPLAAPPSLYTPGDIFAAYAQDAHGRTLEEVQNTAGILQSLPIGKVTTRALMEADGGVASEIDLFEKRGVALDELMSAVDMPTIVACLQHVKRLYRGASIGTVAQAIIHEAEVKCKFLVERALAFQMMAPVSHGGLSFDPHTADRVVLLLSPILGSTLGLDALSADHLVYFGVPRFQAMQVLPILLKMEDEIFAKAVILTSRLMTVSASTSPLVNGNGSSNPPRVGMQTEQQCGPTQGS